MMHIPHMHSKDKNILGFIKHCCATTNYLELEKQ